MLHLTLDIHIKNIASDLWFGGWRLQWIIVVTLEECLIHSF